MLFTNKKSSAGLSSAEKLTGELARCVELQDTMKTVKACPDTFEYERDCFRIGGSSPGSDKWGRVLFLREYASYVKDSMVAELCNHGRNMMFSVVTLVHMPTPKTSLTAIPKPC
jgi:hypothetical protein